MNNLRLPLLIESEEDLIVIYQIEYYLGQLKVWLVAQEFLNCFEENPTLTSLHFDFTVYQEHGLYINIINAFSDGEDQKLDLNLVSHIKSEDYFSPQKANDFLEQFLKNLSHCVQRHTIATQFSEAMGEETYNLWQKHKEKVHLEKTLSYAKKSDIQKI